MRDIEHIRDLELLQQLVSYYKELSEKLFKELKTLREENIRLRGEGRSLQFNKNSMTFRLALLR